jgi:hypothetical protein
VIAVMSLFRKVCRGDSFFCFYLDIDGFHAENTENI